MDGFAARSLLRDCVLDPVLTHQNVPVHADGGRKRSQRRRETESLPIRSRRCVLGDLETDTAKRRQFAGQGSSHACFTTPGQFRSSSAVLGGLLCPVKSDTLTEYVPCRPLQVRAQCRRRRVDEQHPPRPGLTHSRHPCSHFDSSWSRPDCLPLRYGRTRTSHCYEPLCSTSGPTTTVLGVPSGPIGGLHDHPV